jgi:hypothetical protein
LCADGGQIDLVIVDRDGIGDVHRCAISR